MLLETYAYLKEHRPRYNNYDRPITIALKDPNSFNELIEIIDKWTRQ